MLNFVIINTMKWKENITKMVQTANIKTIIEMTNSTIIQIQISKVIS